MTPESPRVSRPELSVFSSGPLLELWVWRDHTCLIYIFFVAAATWNEIHKIQYYCIAAEGAHRGQNIYEIYFLFSYPLRFHEIFILISFGRTGIEKIAWNRRCMNQNSKKALYFIKALASMWQQCRLHIICYDSVL